MPSAQLFTSSEAAAFLGSSPTSVKRWADEGLLRCVKTVGRHRRFEREELDRFRREHMGARAGARGDVSGWLEDLRRGRGPVVVSRLYAERAQLGSWGAVADELGRVLEALGDAWERGDMSVIEEHVASHRLDRDLGHVMDSIPLADRAPRALLLTVPGEAHTLGLSLLQLALREAGWGAIWIGAKTPLAGLASAILEHDASLVAVSSSLHASDEESMARAAAELASICSASGVPLLLGGGGAWPVPPRYGARLRGLSGLARHLP